MQNIADQPAWSQIYFYKATAARTTPPATKAFHAPTDIKAAPPVLVGEDVAPTAVPEPDDDDVVVVMPAADELADEEPEAELETLEDDSVDMADDAVVPDPPVVVAVAVAAAALALDTEAELYNDSLLILLEALKLLITSATVDAAVPLAVRGVALPALQVVMSKPTLMPMRPSS